jgi:alcohol dehydrogenase class IV
MYQFYLPTKIIFGRGSIQSLGKEAKPYGNKAIIVSGKRSLKETGLLAKLEKILYNENIKTAVFSKVLPEPDTNIVASGIAFAKDNNCDLVIGAGGGSAIDVAKSIAGLINITEDNSVSDYLEVDGIKKVSCPGLPFIALPTVAGTGAEVTNNAVLTSSVTGTKRSLRSTYLFSKVAILDPELTLSVPADITAISGIDCLIHLLEGYISKKSNPLCDMFALEGMKLAIDSLPVAVENGAETPDARAKVFLASLYGGIVIVNSGLGLVHGMGSVIGAKYHILHGLACALLLPEILRYNLPAIPESKKEIMNNLFGQNPVNYIKDFLSELGLTAQLSKLHIKKEHIPEIIEKTLTTSSAKKNPRTPAYGDLSDILQKFEQEIS